MSSPIHDDRDKRAMYVPPWARDELRDEETRRIHAEIVAAAERLKPPAPPAHQPRPPKPQRVAPPPVTDFPVRGDRSMSMSTSAPADGPFDVESAMRDAWEPPGLDPSAVQPPPQPKMGGLNWGVVSRLGGRGRICRNRRAVRDRCDPAAVDRYLRVSRSQGCKCGCAFGCRGAQQCKAAQAAAPPVAQPPAAPSVAPPPQAAASQQAALTPAPAAGSGPTSASPFTAVAPVKPSVVEPALPPAPKPAAGLPEARVLDYMSREEIDGLVKRGQDLLAIGDISGGRLLLTRAAEAGDARASFALAGTYDSAVVATLGVVGAFPDAVKARSWYLKAAEQGSTEAARRLEQPHLRQR